MSQTDNHFSKEQLPALHQTYQFDQWRGRVDSDRILWLTLNCQQSTVNILNHSVLQEFRQILTMISDDHSLIGLVILSGKSSGFIAGADVEQFTSLTDASHAFALIRQGQLIFDQLARLKIPTVALIQGFCLGGGLELALACRYRIAQDDPKTVFSAPEVQLGIHPGWGGTIRLPQLLGVYSAMDLNLTGRTVRVKTAVQLGLVDVAIPERHLQDAARFYILTQPKPKRANWLGQISEISWIRPWIGRLLEQKLRAKLDPKHYPAPFSIIKNWVKNGVNGKNAMLDEAKSISELLLTPTCQNLVRVFFLQTRLKSLGKQIDFHPKKIHVIGAGAMGGDIAAWCALKGLRVTLQDQTPQLIASALQRAQKLFRKKLQNPRLASQAMDRLIPDVTGLGVGQADVVIEAISENLDLKRALYRTIEPKLKPNTILATNTSSLSLAELSQGLRSPERLVGIHFFNPVAMMQLVEVVTGAHTDPEVFARAQAFVRCIDRLPLPVVSRPGFLVNRILMPYLLEAMELLEEGCSPASIDTAAIQFGMPMGPLELADTVGLDVCLSVAEIMSHTYHFTVPEALRQKVSKKEWGRKSGQGFYLYEHGQRQKTATVERSGSELEAVSITNRLVLRLLNESVACWREKIVADADLLDAGMIFGTGFAPFRGGPLHYAQRVGITSIQEKLQTLEAHCGSRFKPDEGWGLLTVSNL